MTDSVPLLVTTLQGHIGAKTPVWLMRQAGRYLPEYRAVRANFPDFLQFCLTPDAATEVTLQPLQRFNLDAAIIFADILTIPHAMGHPVQFTAGYGPQVMKITTLGQVTTMAAHLPDFLAKLQPIATTIRHVRAALPTKTTIGFSGAPFTLASYLLDDKPSQGLPNLLAFQREHPTQFATLITTLTQAVIAYLQLQADAGAQVLQVFDSWAGTCPDPLWQTAVHQPLLAIRAALAESHPHIPVILFPRLASQAQLQALATAAGPSTGFSLSTDTDLTWSAANLTPHVVLQGNLDPHLMTLTDPTHLTTAVEKIRQTMATHPHVFNLGHGLTPETKIDRVQQLCELLQA